MCLKKNTFLLQVFLILYTPKQIYALREKKVFNKKKKSFLPTYANFFQAVTWTTHIFLFGLFQHYGSTVRVMRPNDADGMANRVDPDQTDQKSRLILPQRSIVKNFYFSLCIIMTDRSGQTVKTPITLLLAAVWLGSNSVCIFKTHYCMGRPPCSNFKMITADFSGVKVLGILMQTKKSQAMFSWHQSMFSLKSLNPTTRTTSKKFLFFTMCRNDRHVWANREDPAVCDQGL